MVASDGLFDNLFDETIGELLNPFITEQKIIKNLDLAAETIAKEAETFSLSKSLQTPYSNKLN